MISRFAAVFLAALVPLWGQAHFRVGAKAGAPLAAITEGTTSFPGILNRNFWWTVGPMVEIDLPLRFGIEVDILYRRVGFKDTFRFGELRGNMWDFPILAKYRFQSGRVEPYLGAGWTYRRLDDLLRTSASKSNGPVVSFGLRINSKRIQLSPELRYTHWPNQNIRTGFRTNKNQLEALFGITF
jgi:hypothetical protein